MKDLIIILFLFFTNQVVGLDIIPTPKKIEVGDDSLAVSRLDFHLIYDKENQSHPLVANAISLSKQLPIHWTESSTNSISFELSYQGQNKILDKQMKSRVDSKLLDKKEGYRLEINPEGISIYGFDKAGLLYGVQSLRQLLAVNQHLPIMDITDYPTLPFRGIMDDISRGPLSNLEFMKEQVRRLSLLKMNVLTFYVEHVIRTKHHPDYAPHQALTLSEIEELSIYADSFNVYLMGSFQSLGHFKEILKDPAYALLGASERMLRPDDPKAKSFLIDNYDELISAFNYPMFNINADEAYDLERGPHLKRLADSIGIGQIYMNHVKPLLQHISDKGKTPAMWGDMLLKHPEVISQLPKETVVLTWNYGALDDFSDQIDPFVSHGIKFIAAPGIVNSYRLWPDLQEAEKNISNFSQLAWKSGAQGILTTVWDDGGRHFFACDWWGIVVAAEHSWNPEIEKHPGLSKVFYRNFYSGDNDLFGVFLSQVKDVQSIDRLSKLDAAIVEMEFDIRQSSTFFIDTSGFRPILESISEIQATLHEIYADTSRMSPLFSKSDFDFWAFKFQELKQSILSQKELFRITGLLSARRSSLLSSTINIMSQWQRKQWEVLQQEFNKLWFSENRSYWFEEAGNPIANKIDFWNETSRISGRLRKDRDHFPNFEASDETFFTYWLAADFGGEINQAWQTDFFAAEGGELNQKPSAVGYYPKQDGDYHSWRKIISQNPNKVWLGKFYASDSITTVYTSCQIMTSEAGSVPFELLSTGQSEIILNGEDVPSYKGDSPKNILQLKEGRNYLLIKHMRPTSHPWSFSFKLPGQNVQNRKYRYYLEVP